MGKGDEVLFRFLWPLLYFSIYLNFVPQTQRLQKKNVDIYLADHVEGKGDNIMETTKNIDHTM